MLSGTVLFKVNTLSCLDLWYSSHSSRLIVLFIVIVYLTNRLSESWL
jgi:hypothetical protein